MMRVRSVHVIVSVLVLLSAVVPSTAAGDDGKGSTMLVLACIPGVDADKLGSFLRKTASTHRFGYRDSAAFTTASLSFIVSADCQDYITDYTRLLKNRVEEKARDISFEDAPTGSVLIDLDVDEEMQATIAAIYRRGSAAVASHAISFGALLLEPNRDEVLSGIDPSLQSLIGGYRLRYQGGAPAAAWITAGPYVAMDLTAGPVAFGPLNHRTGAVTSIPRRADPSNPADEWYLVDISRAIRSAIRNVFFSDFAFPLTETPEQVLVSVLVFRDHMDDEAVSEQFLNMDVVREEAKKIFPLGTQVHVVSGVHSLHDHRHIAMALMKSAHSKAAHTVRAGRYFATTTRYIDSESLFLELANTGDMLAKDLLDPSSAVYGAFFKQSLHIEELEMKADASGRAPASSSASVNRAWDEMVSELKGELADLPKKAPLSYTAAQDHRNTLIVPIYVFSLHNWEDEIMMEDSSLVHASPTAAVVLQSNNSRLSVPFFIDDARVQIDARFATRNVVAGLALSQGGIMPPTAKYAVAAKETQHDYFWAAGHHPFDFFSNCERISDVYVGAIRRNAVLSRLTYARAKWDASNIYFFKFQKTYGLQHVKQYANVDRKSHEEDDDEYVARELFGMANRNAFTLDDAAALPNQIVRAFEDLDVMRRELMRDNTKIAKLLARRSYEDAYIAVKQYLKDVNEYSRLLAARVREAETKLMCCTVQHTASIVNKTSSLKQYIGVFFFVLCAALPMIAISVCFYSRKLKIFR